MQSVVKMNESTNHSVVEQMHDFVNFRNMFNHVVVRFVLSSHPKCNLGLWMFNPFRIAAKLEQDFPVI